MGLSKPAKKVAGMEKEPARSRSSSESGTEPQKLRVSAGSGWLVAVLADSLLRGWGSDCPTPPRHEG